MAGVSLRHARSIAASRARAAAGPAGFASGRRHDSRRHQLPPQQRRIRRQAASRDARIRAARSSTTTPTAGRTSCSSTAWTGPVTSRERSTLRLYRNNRNGTFTDVTKRAGLDVELYGMGVAVGDYNNDGFPDLFITCVGQNRLFRNTGKGTFVDVTRRQRPRQAVRPSARRRCGSTSIATACSTCSSATTSSGRPTTTCSAASTAKQKSYCTPEAYRGDTCWLFHNRGNGTFEDVTATSGIFDSSSKSLGVAMLDDDRDGWPDLFVANDTQPNKLYRNQRNGTFKDVAVEAGLAFSVEGKARAGMGVDAGDFDNSGRPASPSPTSTTR